MRLFGAGLVLALLGAAPITVPEWPVRLADEKPADLAEKFPNSASVALRLLNQQVEAKDEQAAGATLRKLADMGYALSAAGLEQVKRLLAPEVATKFLINAAALEQSAVRQTIPVAFGLVEAVAPQPGRRLATSGVTAKDLFLEARDKSWKPAGLPGLGSLTGLVTDPRSGTIWAASGVFDQSPAADDVFRGLIAFDPQSGKIRRKIAAPPDGSPSDITISADGTLYASDPISGAIYRAPPGEDRMDLLVRSGRLASPQGLALSADGLLLYVSDYRYGLAVIDLATRKLMRLAAEGPMMLNGIDGLMRRGSDLIGIQNGARPIRIVAIRLSRDGLRANQLRVLEQANPAWIEPTSGFTAGNRLVYVGNAAWDRYGTGGVVQGEGALVPTEIRSLPL